MGSLLPLWHTGQQPSTPFQKMRSCLCERGVILFGGGWHEDGSGGLRLMMRGMQTELAS